jgi:hypothetical protein
VKSDPFRQLIDQVEGDLIVSQDEGFVAPSDAELHDFAVALNYFRNGLADSSRAILRKYNYALERVNDGRTGAQYDVIRERHPAHFGWGTYVYNEHYAKRLNVQIPHPADDVNALSIGVELFRTSHAEWLMIAGTGKMAASDKFSSDMARARQSVFQRVHETLANPALVALSIHAFSQKFYQGPIAASDIVLSNGTTTDEQWGISQLSLAYRDTLRRSGFSSGVAMYDSGYGALSASTNPQGMYSNGHSGFGRWLNVELSNSIRENQLECAKFIQATDRALDFNPKILAQQANRVFGLVSPRVVRIDSAHPIMFPAPGQQTYRIISFNATRARNDTLNVHVGSWLNVFNSDRPMTRIQALDSSGSIIHEFRQTHPRGSRDVLASIVERSSENSSSSGGSRDASYRDSTSSDDEGGGAFEPIQVHRIPLQPMVLTSGITQGEITTTSYRWNGVLQSGFSASVPVFRMTDGLPVISEADGMPSFLIPIMSNSYRTAGSKFVGVQMTKVLVEEIERLVTDQDRQQRDISLVAEENANGEYYLRIFPAQQPAIELAEMK